MLGKGLTKFMSAESDLILSVRLRRRKEDRGEREGCIGLELERLDRLPATLLAFHFVHFYLKCSISV